MIEETHKSIIDFKSKKVSSKVNVFEKIKYILIARNELNRTITYAKEYKSMGTYADDNKPLAVKDLDNSIESLEKKNRIKFIKEMSIICILEIIKNKKIEKNVLDGEWSYQDKKMATICLRNFINKILSLNYDNIKEERLKKLLVPFRAENEDVNTLVKELWQMLETSFLKASNNNNIANNSFYKLFDEIEVLLVERYFIK